MAATEQSKVLFAALYAREYNKFQEYAKTFARPSSAAGISYSVDECPIEADLPWSGIGEQAWIASRAYAAAKLALGELQSWAEQLAQAAEGETIPNGAVREDFAEFAGISETAP